MEAKAPLGLAAERLKMGLFGPPNVPLFWALLFSLIFRLQKSALTELHIVENWKNWKKANFSNLKLAFLTFLTSKWPQNALKRPFLALFSPFWALFGLQEHDNVSIELRLMSM